MNVMSSVMRGARRLVHTDPALLSNFLSVPLLRPAESSAALLTCQQNRRLASKQVSLLNGQETPAWLHVDVSMCRQVRGQKKDQKSQKVRAKVDKQEVEIRQRMTVASLAEAMNKDFGRTSCQRGVVVLDAQLNKVSFIRSRSRVGGSAEHLGGSGLSGAGLGSGGQVD